VIVDTSALVAILRAEPDAERYARAIAAAEHRRISAATWVETAIVIGGGDPVREHRFDDFVTAAGLTIEPVTVEQAGMARTAYREYGRASGHRARLNFGDCFTYALARATGEPLLFKGDDFARTDLRPALGDVDGQEEVDDRQDGQ